MENVAITAIALFRLKLFIYDDNMSFMHVCGYCPEIYNIN